MMYHIPIVIVENEDAHSFICLNQVCANCFAIVVISHPCAVLQLGINLYSREGKKK